MDRDFEGATVVVTGASSGIGRATCRAFGERGADVVAAARRADLLDEAVREVEALGGRGLAVPTDVTDLAAVQALLQAAVARFGHVDVWVNAAGVALFGRFVDTPPDLADRLMRVNFGGVANGHRAVLPHYLLRGRGTVVDLSSIDGVTGQRLASVYAASKAAVRILGSSLRQELDGMPDIHVCTLLPGPVDTPIWTHAANYTGREVRPPGLPAEPETVAEAIVELARRPRPEAHVGASGRLVAAARALAPGLSERIASGTLKRSDLLGDRPAPSGAGSLERPMREGAGASGGYLDDGDGAALVRPGGAAAAALAVGALAVPAAIWLARRAARRRERVGAG
jgi:NADP-dependent 3-hydroxy acid dehydrogenase YdfG